MSDPNAPYLAVESRVARWARPVLVYVITGILALHFGVLSAAEAFCHVSYTHLTVPELAILVTPVMTYIFLRWREKEKGIAS